jgi:hypothetical protein
MYGTREARIKLAATIMDYAPIVNIPPFAMCQSLANPTVATATTAALGVFRTYALTDRLKYALSENIRRSPNLYYFNSTN